MKTEMKTRSRQLTFVGPGKMALTAVAAVALSCATPAREAAGAGLTSARGSYEVEVLLDGMAAPRFAHRGESYVMGQLGRRYTLRVWNRSSRRVEAVVSVDGRDVVDGKPGDFRHKRGYLVPAWGFVDIDGWRLSEHQAAAFRFSSVADSYAARVGSPRNVGVIGVAVFPERPRPAYIAPPPVYSRADRHQRSVDDDLAAPAPPASAPADRESARSGSGSLGGLAEESARAETDAPKAKGTSASAERRRPGLGTAFGESVSSQVTEVFFLRENPGSPEQVLGLRYNDRRGLLAMGIDVDGHRRRRDEAWLRQSADPFPVSGRYASPPLGWRAGD